MNGCAPGGHESRAGDIVRQAELFAENVERWHEKVVAEDVEADEHVGHEDRRACGENRAHASMFQERRDRCDERSLWPERVEECARPFIMAGHAVLRDRHESAQDWLAGWRVGAPTATA